MLSLRYYNISSKVIITVAIENSKCNPAVARKLCKPMPLRYYSIISDRLAMIIMKKFFFVWHIRRPKHLPKQRCNMINENNNI